MSLDLTSLKGAEPEWEQVSLWLHRQVCASGIPHPQAQDIAQDLLIVLVEKHSGGSLDIQGPAASYLHQMVRNALKRAYRRRERRAERPMELFEPVAASQVAWVQEAEQAEALLERVLHSALAARVPRYRPELQRTWSEIFANATGALSHAQLIAREPDAQEDRARAAGRVYKRHSRVREAMLQAARTLVDQEDRRWALRLLGCMRYCQKSQPRGSVSLSEE